MLDVTVCIKKGPEGGVRLSYEPYFKPTYRPIPLRQFSAHPAAVHSSLFSRVFRLWRNSDNVRSFEKALAVLFHEYAVQLMDSSTIERCMSIRPWNKFSVQGGRCKPVRYFVLVIDYHPLLAKAQLERVANQVLELYRYPLENLLGHGIGIRVAWRKAGPHMSHLLRSLGRKMRPDAPKGGW